jgi:hypothetical protein
MSADAASLGLESPPSLNRYVYGLNNPLRYVDPDGRDPQEFVDSLFHIGFQLKNEWGRPLPLVTQVTLAGVVMRGNLHAVLGSGEMIGGTAIGIAGLAGMISEPHPLWLLPIGVGGYFAHQGYEPLRESSSDLSSEFSQAYRIYQFENGIQDVFSQLNATTVRDFTDQQLWDAKTAAQSIRDQGFLPIQLRDQLLKDLWMIEAELERRRQEAIKRWEEQQKVKQN